jgi:riboflavin synthase
MFTGIIEAIGLVQDIEVNKTNRSFWISSPISTELKVDQSISHDGVCLTVDAIRPGEHRVTAIEETLKKTNLSTWSQNDKINLERSLTIQSRIDGHIVQGHADCVTACLKKKDHNGSHEYVFSLPKKFAGLVIEKGSIAINGISLTCFDVKKKTFRVAVIPYTYEHTNISNIKVGSMVNIEFDMLGKYILRRQTLNKN